MPNLHEIVTYADALLRTGEIADWDNALNGLQIENSGSVSKIAAAVDASTRVLQESAARKADLLLVHHGLFWPGLRPVTAGLRRQLKIAFENDIALYSTHLPLDAHADIGNNALLAAALGLRSPQPFFNEKGTMIGMRMHCVLARDELARRLARSLGIQPKLFLFGPEQTSRIGIVTGGAGGEIYRMAEENIDTFITGEAPHWAAIAAEELGMNLILGGHYATETFGVKALAAHLAERFDLPSEFIDCPTGL